MDKTKNYGTVEDIIGNEGEGIGNLAFVAILDPSELMPEARIVIGSNRLSDVNLGQFAVSYKQAGEMIDILQRARLDIATACPAHAKD